MLKYIFKKNYLRIINSLVVKILFINSLNTSSILKYVNFNSFILKIYEKSKNHQNNNNN